MKKPLYLLRRLSKLKPNQLAIFKVEVSCYQSLWSHENTIQPFLKDLWDFLFEWFIPNNIGSLHVFSPPPPFFTENIQDSFIKKQELKALNLWDVIW